MGEAKRKAQVQVGRLAMRVEGEYWNAYYALPDTMDAAIHLGSIRMAFVQDQGRKAAFMTLMRQAVGEILKQNTGHEPNWVTSAAPERERSGSA